MMLIGWIIEQSRSKVLCIKNDGVLKEIYFFARDRR